MTDPGTNTSIASNMQTVMQIVQFATSAVVVTGTVGLLRVLWGIEKHLGRLNGSVGELRQWKEDHLEADRADEANHRMTREQCQALHAERLASVHRQMDVLFRRGGDRRQGDQVTD